MKQIAQYQDGRMELQEVPSPTPPPGGALVRVTHSVISIGTEKMKVEQARMNLLQKAKARPDQVRKVLETARNLGWRAAWDKVKNRLSSPTPLGYSAAGIVERVDPGNTRFRVGDRVACAGAECAFHAEYIAQPDLLMARVPDSVDGARAAYTTVASIAMQAVRQAGSTLGDRVLVMGQGLVGLLATQLLAIAGVRVMAVDLLGSRRPLASRLGAEQFVHPGETDLLAAVDEWSQGFGVDSVLVCAAARDNRPVEQAVAALRDRGRLVIVGNTPATLDWKTCYEKEIDLRYSRSYGPGRYDPAYEFGGGDYPIGQVRWTENRNFEACLHLMSTGQLQVEALTTRTVRFADCLEVYRELGEGTAIDVGVVIDYDARNTEPVRDTESQTEEPPPDRDFQSGPPIEAVDIIGAGNFARTMLLPHLKGHVPLGTVVNQTALSANHVLSTFGFRDASTDATQALSAPGHRAVLITTRHHLHAELVLAALQTDRHVFVEKPLCLRREELAAIDEAVPSSRGSLQIGFNRRFAPASVELKKLLTATPGPKTATIRVNAGRLDPSHWYANHAESGGRVLGEACHFLDYLCFLFGSRPVRVFAQPIGDTDGAIPFPDSIAAQVGFEDGSVGQLIYSGRGDPGYPKETITVFGSGLVAEVENFQKMSIHRGRTRSRLTFNSKGHAEQMLGWAAFLMNRGPHLFPYEQGRQSMHLTFAALESMQQGRALAI